MPSPALPRPPGRHRLPPFPTGWYAVALSTDLRPGEHLRTQLGGEDVMVWRTEGGKAVVSSAYCPHLGADLADARVQGDALVCPFHGFAFSPHGRCVSTPYEGPPPPAAKLRVWVADERHGAIFAWLGPLQEAPSFPLPELEEEGWTPFVGHIWRDVPSHPQETTENSVDVGHFTEVHGYFDVQSLQPLTLEGPVLRSAYTFARKALPPPFGRVVVRPTFNVQAHGLGYSLVEVDVPQFRMQTRQMVYSTPTREGHIDLRIALSIRWQVGELPGPLGRARLPKAHLEAWVARWLRRSVMKGFIEDVGFDVPIWSKKAYVPRPALAKGDGPVGRYRAWARQFYPQDAAGA